MAHAARLASAAILVGFLSALAAPRAEAQLVTRNGTTIFENGFEADTVGLQPATPLVGAWSQLEPGNPARLGVYGPASVGPGAKFGNKYLHAFRPDSPSNLYMFVDFPQPIVDGDLLHLETWLWIDQPPKDYNLFMGFESVDLSSYVWVAASSLSNGAGGYRLLTRGGNQSADLADLAFIPQTWHKWTMDYVVGSSQVTLGIDDVTQIRSMDAGDTALNPLTRLRIASSNFPTTFYMDGEQAAFGPGDVNFDRVVNIFDINLVSANWGTPGGPTGDGNVDGNVDIFDINLISANWTPAAGGGAAVPEPASFILLAVGAALGLWRLRVR